MHRSIYVGHARVNGPASLHNHRRWAYHAHVRLVGSPQSQALILLRQKGSLANRDTSRPRVVGVLQSDQGEIDVVEDFVHPVHSRIAP